MQGKVLAGRYQLISLLGEGGMGAVWRAEHLTLHTPLAIKLMDPAIVSSDEALARFQREAQAAAELRSTHIVQIFDYGVDGDTPYIAMELLEGETLAARLARHGKLTVEATVTILAQVARALTRAHERGIIHRDLKPENIFLVSEGDAEIAKVLDFGIAKKTNVLSNTGGIKTHTGVLLGTPYYMSPEQALGQTNIDHTTDIWSFGIIATECLTGVRPFDGETLGALLVNICHHAIPAPSSLAPVPAGFDAWFARTTSRDQKARFQSASEASAALKALGETSSNAAPLAALVSVVVEPPPQGARLAETAGPASMTIPGLPSKHPRRATLFVLPALALLVVAGALGWQRLVASNALEVATNVTSAATQGATHAETNTTAGQTQGEPAAITAATESGEANRQRDAGAPIVLTNAQSPSLAVSAAPTLRTPRRAPLVARAAGDPNLAQKKKGVRAERDPVQPSHTTHAISNNAAGF